MLDSVSWVRTGVIAKYSLVRRQHHVDRPVTVGVNANPKAMRNGIIDRIIYFFLAHREDAMVVRAFVWRTHIHRTL